MAAPTSAQRTSTSSSSSKRRKQRVARPAAPQARDRAATGGARKPSGSAGAGDSSKPVKVTVRRKSWWARTSPHVKVMAVVAFWLVVMIQQATMITQVQLYSVQVFTVLGALVICGVLAVYLYPPRTPRWRTLVWEYLASTVAGTLGYALLGGRAGYIAALACGGLVLVLRCNQLGRRGARRLRDKYYAWRLRPRRRAGRTDA